MSVFMEVIEWVDHTADEIVHRVPEQGSGDIKFGAQLIVREYQIEDFRKYGLELADLYINRITPPEDVQKMIDARSGMAAVGNLDHFFKFKAAKALGDAAIAHGYGDPGAASGMGMGVGMGMGMMLPGMMYRVLDTESPQLEAIAAHGTVHCPECYHDVAFDSRFCSACGHQMVVVRKCPQCQKNLTANANFCSSCGLDLTTELRCRSCHTILPPETRFFFHCGEAVVARNA